MIKNSVRQFLRAGKQVPSVVLFFLMIVCLAVPRTAKAAWAEEQPAVVDPVGERDRCSYVLYNNTNGLPTSEANDIVQTQEGFIWIGSYAGLVRYDGSRFELTDPTTGVTSVKCLFVDSRNRLWVGTNDNGVVLVTQVTEMDWSVTVNDENSSAGTKVKGFTEISLVSPIDQNDSERVVVA